MKTMNYPQMALSWLLLLIHNQLQAGGVPFATDDLNLEAAINSNGTLLDVLSNDTSGISNDPFKEVIAVCDSSSSDFDCTSTSYTSGNHTVSVNGSGADNNVLFFSDGSMSGAFAFKYVMQNSQNNTGSAQAAVATSFFEVNSLSDAGTGGCGSFECTLREAITAAANDGEASNIAFVRDLTGTIVTNSTLTIDSIDLSINGPGANNITISGNNSHRVLLVTSGSERFMLSGVTISDGMTGSGEQGGGIFIAQATETMLENLRVTNNQSASNGGGIYAQGAGFTLRNSEISHNTAGIAGGGVGLNGFFGNDVTIENVTISNNQSNNPGAGLAVVANSGQNIDLRFVTSAFNTGNTDNRIGAQGNITIESSIFVPGLSMSNDSNVTNNSIIENYSGSTLNGNNNLINSGSLMLRPLAEINSSGLSGHSFTTDSPAHNHVDNMVGNPGCGTVTLTDQFGTTRPTDGGCDAGAFEYLFIDLIFADPFE